LRSPELSFLWLPGGPCTASWSARGFDAGVLKALRRDGVLRQAETPEEIECPSCYYSAAVIEIQRQTRADGSIRLYGVCPECGIVDLAAGDCVRYAVDYGAVVGILSAGLEIGHPPEERTPGRRWRLGQTRIAGKVRHAWACRDDIDGDGDFPQGGVVFMLGPARGNSEGVLLIPAGDVFYWKDGLVLDRVACDAYAEPAPVSAAAKKSTHVVVKRTPRLNLIDVIIKELERWAIDTRDDFYTSRAEGWKWRWPDPPSQKYLSLRLEVSESSISRALADDAGKRAKALLENCADEKFILNFRKTEKSPDSLTFNSV